MALYQVEGWIARVQEEMVLPTIGSKGTCLPDIFATQGDALEMTCLMCDLSCASVVTSFIAVSFLRLR